MIDVHDLRYTYERAKESAIDRLTFKIGEGEVFGFLGPNGAGKSTTQRILIGLLRGYQGDVSVLGKAMDAWNSDFYEHIGVGFESPNHYLKLTALENLRYFRRLYAGKTLEPVELLERVGLDGSGDMLVSQFSKGMKCRLSMARALLNDAELLFLDEPTSGLDPVSARRMKEIIQGQRAAGKTVFLTTHDMAVADELCDRVAFIIDGTISVIETPRQLKLMHGEPRLRVEFHDNGALQKREFPLPGIADDASFQKLLRHPRLETIHTLEASLEDVFVDVTGRPLE